MVKQRPHWRTSKRGRKFRAGRGSPKVRRASKLRRDMIRKDLVMTGPYRKPMVRVLEKYPSIHRKYIESGFPVVETVPEIYAKDKGKDKKLWGRRVPYMEQGSNKKFQHDKLLLDENIFKKAIMEERSHLGTKIPVTPKVVSKHELSHIENSNFVNEYLDPDMIRFDEEIADLRGLFDERRLKVPEDKQKDKFGKVFSEGFK